MDIPPEIAELCGRIKNQWGTVRDVDETFYKRALTEAIEYNGCYFSFWNIRGMRTLVVFREDRVPEPPEFLPFLQEIFEDGTIQELVTTPYSRHFVQGEPVYITDSMADTMANMLANYADRKDEIEQFDFDQTKTAKRMRRNGHT